MPDLIGYPAAAAKLGITVSALRVWVHRGQVPHVRLGRRSVRFDPSELDRWIESRKVDVEP